MPNGWIGIHAEIEVQNLKNPIDFQSLGVNSYSGPSILPDSQALSKTFEAPPISILPLTATNIKAPTMEIICTTSVHTTALRPP